MQIKDHNEINIHTVGCSLEELAEATKKIFGLNLKTQEIVENIKSALQSITTKQKDKCSFAEVESLFPPPKPPGLRYKTCDGVLIKDKKDP